ncbi:MAG TPA: transcription termination/antitermination protein NusG [Mesotoga sp.]|nr:transcription termination/antitermination protein NusG [Mesotoga sp.]MDD5744109.1 transcription termination/antitermination protein NusG [Mesotoga sp.]HQQ57019.1 transcription termination/antitermination protein NusG [Mesotoga sp.]
MRKKWFIIQTYSGLENSIREAIQTKIESFGFSHLFGKILVPEETKLDRANAAAEKHIIPANARLLVKENQDVAKGEPVAEELEIKVKNDGAIAEVKNYRVIFIETADRRYTKTYYIPESAKIETGVKTGARIRQGMPLAKSGEYFCELDGKIVYTQKMKRVVIERVNGEEDVYLIHPDSCDMRLVKRGTTVKRGDVLGDSRKVTSKTEGRIELSELPGRKEIKIFKIIRTRLYPGYVFIEMIMNEETLNLVKNTPNVVNFVSVGGQPVELKGKEVKALLRLVGIEDYEEHVGPIKIEVEFEIGEIVRINSGPFEDFVGKITDLDPERQELKVVVSIFGRETPVILGLSEVEKIV